MNVGVMLKYYRGLYNLTQSEVAEMSGINEKYLGRIERNESIPTVDKVEQLCMAFDIRVADLLTPTTFFLDGFSRKMESFEGEKKTAYYCNCCGEYFLSDEEIVKCPNCSCEYSEDNNYIEKYTIVK